jgi:transketolase
MTAAGEEKPQRLVFGEMLVELGAADERVVVLDADVSCSTQTRHFGARFPERFFNLGICEANMISVAAGLATTGCVPFASTFALFVAMRAGEQVRAQVAYPRLNVKLIGGYAGFSDFADGASHQSVEDIAVMRAVPNMTVISPSDITTTRAALRAMLDDDGPAFLRLSRDAVVEDYPGDHPFEIGRAIEVRAGRDVAIVATGTMVRLAREAAEILEDRGVSARLIDMHTIKPLDRECVERAARETGAVVTVEEHNVLGGLGAAVCETVCEACPVPVARVGIPDRFGETGAYRTILKRAGLSPEKIAAAAERAIAAKEEQG